MSYRFLDHTADVGAELAADSLGELFAEALAAFTDTITRRRSVGRRRERRFRLAAADADALLVDWLSEVLYAYEVDGLLLHDAAVSVEEEPPATGDAASRRLRLDAVARGEVYDPDRHPIKVLIKGVTYHGLRVEQRDDGRWHASIVFDI